MGAQGTFAALAWNSSGKLTGHERFLAETDAVIPWLSLIGLIEPHYSKAATGARR
jgi:IS5 family transposase